MPLKRKEPSYPWFGEAAAHFHSCSLVSLLTDLEPRRGCCQKRHGWAHLPTRSASSLFRHMCSLGLGRMPDDSPRDGSCSLSCHDRSRFRVHHSCVPELSCSLSSSLTKVSCQFIFQQSLSAYAYVGANVLQGIEEQGLSRVSMKLWGTQRSEPG